MKKSLIDIRAIFGNLSTLIDELNGSNLDMHIKHQLIGLELCIQELYHKGDLDIHRRLNFLLDIMIELNDLSKMYQMRSSSFSEPETRKIRIRNYIHFQILNQLMLWYLVTNSYNQFAYNNAVAANLLEKILSIQNSDHRDEINLLGQEFTIEGFLQKYSYHHTIAGLFSSAIWFLGQLDRSTVQSWVIEAFAHYNELNKLVQSIGIEELYNIGEKDKGINLSKLSVTIIQPVLDFNKLISHLYRIFGDDWRSELDLNAISVPNWSKPKYRKKMVEYVDRLIDAIKFGPNDYVRIKEKVLDTDYWRSTQVIVSIIRHYDFVTSTMRSYSQGSNVSGEHIQEQHQFIQSLYRQLTTHKKLIHLSYYYNDSLVTLAKLLLLAPQVPIVSKVNSMVVIKENLVSNGNVLHHEMALIYVLSRFQFLSVVDRAEIKKILDEINQILIRIRADSPDSIMIRIFSIQLEFCYMEIDPKHLIGKLTDILNHIVPQITISTSLFSNYIHHLITSMNGEVKRHQDQVFEVMYNLWDWRTWLIPELKNDIEYVPINSKQFRIRSDSNN